ncbi:hypothetical protein BJ508DRAFT_414265 [Ascobolus immersus RN42]|uniref:Uncharacterized protein n=1 Tax=Ascobolus immersus RN42 TaxID=1160509 RepID=A0A3N4IDK0_ASCIM|nr:hypothetical protein BJ508DRAFT_414265 [Ascobolus immersus RN42]
MKINRFVNGTYFHNQSTHDEIKDSLFMACLIYWKEEEAKKIYLEKFANYIMR